MADRIGIYLRISDDREGNQTATERQQEDCRKFAAGKGWEVVDVFEDVDLSAFQRTVRRPEFERMLQAVSEKAIDGVLAWKLDRITRRQRDLVRLDEACEDVGGFIATVVDQIDTREPASRFVAELLTAQARMESENASIRVRRQHEERAKKGAPVLGGVRAFGWTADRTAVISEEATLIREAAQRVFAGEGIRGICLDWERRGVKSSAGKTWKASPLRAMLMRATLSGQREHRGVLTKGTWRAILKPAQTQKLKAILGADSRRTNRGNARRYLLSGGFLRCGRCGHALIARPRGDGVRRYVCARQPGMPNCGKLARLAEPVEDVVKQAVITALDGADIAEYLRVDDEGSDDALLDSVRADEETLEQLSRDHYSDGVITRAEYFAARDPIEARLTANRSELARTTNHTMLTTVAGAGAEIAKQWDDQTLDWRRAVVGAVIDHVVLLPAVRGLNRFDPTLVEPVWRF